MPHQPKPFFRTARDAWYVQLGKNQVKLAPGPKNAATEKTAWAAFHRLMTDRADGVPKSANPAAEPTVAEVFEKFLDWCQRHREPRTYEFYRDRIQSFLDASRTAALPADELKPFHVQDWADGKPTWGPMQRRGAIVSVQRPFAWAEKMGHILKSPVRHVEKPPPKRRDQVLTRAEFDAMLAAVPSRPFRDVLEFCWETGARVQEVRLIEARHLTKGGGRVDLPPPEAKGKKRWRTIYLTDRAGEIVARLAGERPLGPVFRNTDGLPWEARAFNCCFCRLQKKLGMQELARRGEALDEAEVRRVAGTLEKTKVSKGVVVAKDPKELIREARKKLSVKVARKYGTKFALTAIRHSYATRLLEAGVDHITVAALMGHVDAVMLSKTYSHISDRDGFLRGELKKADG